jgi:N-acetylglutamate synthase-like GNAT family acetyltransferase
VECKTKVIPVIVGATGKISKSFIKYLNNTIGKHDIKKVQRTALLNTAHLLRKLGYANVKEQNLCYEK